MSRYLVSMFLAMFLASNALAQDETPVDITPEKAADLEEVDGESVAEVAEDADEVEDADLDEQTYEDEDDDFVPTEEINVRDATQFPTNI